MKHARSLIFALCMVSCGLAQAGPQPEFSQFVTLDADGRFVNEFGPFMGYGCNYSQTYPGIGGHDPGLYDMTRFQSDLRNLRARGFTHLVQRIYWGFYEEPDYLAAPGQSEIWLHEEMVQRWEHALDLIEASGMYVVIWFDTGNSWPTDLPGEERYDTLWKRERFERFKEHARNFATRFRDRKVIMGWRSENENYPLAWESVFAQPPELLGYWHDHLTAKYGDVGTLNAKWGSSYGAIGAIPLPTDWSDPLLMEYNYFREALVSERNQELAAELRAADPNHLILISNITGAGGGATLFEHHDFSLLDEFDVLGNAAYASTRNGGFSTGNDSILSLLKVLRPIQSFGVAGMITENGMHHDVDTPPELRVTHQQSADYIWSQYLDVVGVGAAGCDIYDNKTIAYDEWYSPTGVPAPDTVELRESERFIERVDGIDTKFAAWDAEVLILRSSAMGHSGQGAYADQGWYYVIGDWLYQLHVPFDVRAETTIDAALLSNYKAVIIADQYRLFDDSLWLLLRNWVEGAPGRVLVNGFWLEQDSHFQPKTPGADMRYLVGFDTSTYVTSYHSGTTLTLQLPAPFGDIPAGTHCPYVMQGYTLDIPTPLDATAQVIALRSDKPAVPVLVENALPIGSRVYTFGMSPGEFSPVAHDGMVPMYREILDAAGVAPAFTAPTNLGVHLAGDHSALLFKERFAEATDEIFSGSLGGAVYDAALCEIGASGVVTLRESIRSYGWRVIRRLPVAVVPAGGVTSVAVTTGSLPVFACNVSGGDAATFTVDELIPSQDYLLAIDGAGTTTLTASAGGSLNFVVPAGVHTVALTAGAGAGTIVTIPDPNLEAAIRDAIHKPGGVIYDNDLAGHTELRAPFAGITNLTGLEHWAGLKTLYLPGNAIADLTPLQGLTQLKRLNVSENVVSSLAALSALVNIQVLDVTSNTITDVTPLENITALSQLYAPYNQIGDLAPLRNLPNLHILLLEGNQIVDLEPLALNADMASSDLLRLEDNPLSETSVATHVPTLVGRGVTVRHNSGVPVDFPDPNLDAAIRSAIGKPVGQIYSNELVGVDFDSINAGGAGIVDLTGAENCLDWQAIDLSGNVIDDFSPLSGLYKMQWLNLVGVPLSDLSAFSQMIFMTGINIAASGVDDLSPMTNMTKLANFWADGCHIADLTPLQALTYLDLLYLRNNPIQDIGPLAANTGLKTNDTLDLIGCPLSAQAVNVDIPALEARGVIVTHDRILGAAPEISVYGAWMEPVTDGVTVIDLGTVEIGASTPTVTITVQNNGEAGSALYLTSLSVGGPFLITEGLDGGLAAGNHDTFTIECPTDSNGVFSQTVTIDNDDSDENPFTFTVTATVQAVFVVDFPDANLEAAIRTAIGKPTGDIYNTDLVGVGFDTLSAPGAGIVNLEGLQYCVDLMNVDLSDNAVGDFSPLATLTQMTYLSLVNTTLCDLTPLAGMTGMAGLDIRNNQVADLTPLAGMTLLQTLFAGSNLIEDLTPLQGMTQITGFWLDTNRITDISPLLANGGLSAGDTLGLEFNPLTPEAVDTDGPALQARGVTVTHTSDPSALPEIEVHAGATPLVDGSSLLDLGTVDQGTTAPTLTIRVRNDGQADSSLLLSNLNAVYPFSVIENLAGGLIVGDSDTFTLQCSTAFAGTYSETVSIDTNDADENPFTFTVTATVEENVKSSIRCDWQLFQ